MIAFKLSISLVGGSLTQEGSQMSHAPYIIYNVATLDFGIGDSGKKGARDMGSCPFYMQS